MGLAFAQIKGLGPTVTLRRVRIGLGIGFAFGLGKNGFGPEGQLNDQLKSFGFGVENFQIGLTNRVRSKPDACGLGLNRWETCGLD